MLKQKIKKFNTVFISIILLLNLFIPVISIAAVSGFTGKINNTTVFNSDYSFTPKFIKNITTTQSYGMTNYSADYLCSGTEVLNSSTHYVARLTSNSQKGNIWVRYNNVGTYNGQIIDLKITLSGWNYLQPENTSADSSIGGVNYPTVVFDKNDISVGVTSMPAVDSPSWTFTFYINGTNQTISTKGHLTFKDLDGSTNGGNEKIIFKSGFDSAYITQNSYLTINSTQCENQTTTSTSSSNQSAWVTCLNNGSSLSFIYTREKDIKGNSYRNIIKTAYADSRIFYSYVIGAESIAPFEFTTPKKSCNQEKLRGLEEATYTISQFIPGESSKYYYTQYILTDEISDCFEIKNIFITDDSKKDKSSWFSISTTNNLITISANSTTLKNSDFYNNNFYFCITISKKADQFIAKWNNENTCIIPNTANIKITSPSISGTRNKTLTTNTVNISLYKEFILPKTGSIGDLLFTTSGTAFITLYIVLKKRK